jgi:hypothetical protein
LKDAGIYDLKDLYSNIIKNPDLEKLLKVPDIEPLISMCLKEEDKV